MLFKFSSLKFTSHNQTIINLNMLVLPQNKLLKSLCQSLGILSLSVYIIYIFWYYSFQNSSYKTLVTKISKSDKDDEHSHTDISHLVFGLAGTSKVWMKRKHYVESWWQANKTRGFIFLDRPPRYPWPASSPPYRVSEDTSRYRMYDRHRLRHAIRMLRVVEEVFKAENSTAKWYVMTDDDTILFMDNLVEVLGRYDHTEYLYIGMNSECIGSNVLFSFDMAFGGGGYALSFPLAKALAMNMDVCIQRYPTLHSSDFMMQACIADFGVSLTRESGFHQIDIHHDISGYLSAHPQVPLISLHHLDVADPIFRGMNRSESVNHLMKAAKTDSSRILQQSMCYSIEKNWTFSVSWGYSVHIYEAIYPPSVLERPLETFWPWIKWARPPYVFNTRLPSKNPCEAPHVLVFDNVEKMKAGYTVTSYARKSPRNLVTCSSNGNHSANQISFLQVLSSQNRRNLIGSRRECCDIVHLSEKNGTQLKLRPCMKNEIVPRV